MDADPVVFAVGLVAEAWAALGHAAQWVLVIGAGEWWLLAAVDWATRGRERRCGRHS